MTEFEWVAVAIVFVTSTARITRLITWDHYPPSIWLRIKWDTITHDGPWSLLAHCGYCFSFWAGAAVLAWGYFTDWQTAWWLVNGALGGSYLAAILMANDGDDSE